MSTLRGRIVTPEGIVEGTLTLGNGRIERIEPGGRPRADHDYGRSLVVPGFLDVHMHGLGEHGVVEVDDLLAVARMQCRFGTTGFLPAAASLSEPQYCEFGRNVARARRETGPRAAEILGSHFEGPFINPAGKAGMDGDFLRPVDLDECRRYLAAAEGTLRLMTLSPELPGSEALIALLVEHGVVASLGHSRATLPELERAVAAGLSQVCHCFNAFERGGNDPDWPWRPGLLDGVLAHPRLFCEVICDLVHVRPLHVRLAAERVGPERFLAITDSLPGAGLPPGEHVMVDGRQFTTTSGAARLTSNGMLVGSVLTMNRAFANLVGQCGIDPVGAARFTSTNAARALGLGEELGSIAPGRRANLAVLDDDFRCLATWRDGRPVYDAREEEGVSG